MNLRIRTLGSFAILIFLTSIFAKAHIAIPAFDLKGEGQMRNIKTSFFDDQTRASETLQSCRIYATLLSQNPIIDIEVNVDCDADPNQWPQMFSTKLQLHNTNQELFSHGEKIGNIDDHGKIHVTLEQTYQSEYFPYIFKCTGDFAHKVSKLKVQTQHSITFSPLADQRYSFSMNSRESVTFKDSDRENCKQLPERKETLKEFQPVNLESWNEVQ